MESEILKFAENEVWRSI